MTTPVRLLVSARLRDALRNELHADLATALAGRSHELVEPRSDADVAFVSRDVTGLSTKYRVLRETQQFYDALLGAPSLRWVHVHSAGADRPFYSELRRRGIELTTSSGTNADVVVQTALAGLLALARRLPQLMQAQRARLWSPLVETGLPRDLAGQTAVIVGWGPIGQRLGALLRMLGLTVIAVRSRAEPAGEGIETVTFEALRSVLPRADWLVLACPLTDRTRNLLDREALDALPECANLINVARGEVVVEAALCAALTSGALSGAYLDVFEQEPLPPDSPLWLLPNVIATPHTAGHSDGHEERVTRLFLENLRRWNEGDKALLNRVR